MPRQFHIVDVFAQERYAGNQLAVVTDAADLSTVEMQAIAAEFDYSETTFVTGPPEDGAWPVRIFTPAEEIPFAGHPTLGTAWVIREHLADGPTDSVTLDLEVGEIPVAVRERDGAETLWMTQQSPTFGDQLPHERLAAVLGLSPDQLDDDWPVEVVSTGLPTIVVPLVDRAALEAIDVDRDAYDAVTGDRDAKLVLAFCADPREPDNDLAVRMFAPYYDVPEDPATGSSNGCLSGYLARHDFFGDGTVDARAEQGYEMGRPSLLWHDSEADDHPVDGVDGGTITVEIGGAVIPVARGELL